MDLGIEGNAALVLASSSGLGKASAKALAREGANVVINGRGEDRLEAAADEIRREATGDVIAQRGDITERGDIEALVDRAVDEFGGLDHLVTSAGGPAPRKPLEADDEEWYDTYDLLVMSVVRAVREAAPHLSADGGGTIVNVTSRVVKEATAGNVLSSSVRMAVIGFEKSLSKDLAPEVRTNAVLPGGHLTPRFEEFDEGTVDSIRRRIPLDRFADPIELGDAVAYLSSPRSGFINGQSIVLDGGFGNATL